MFCARRDCGQDMEAIKYAGRRFNCYTFTSRRDGIGWPFGANELWFATMTHIYEQRVLQNIPNYKAILTFEADCVPLVRDWVSKLSEEFSKCNAKVVGYMQSAPALHINGNCLFSGDITFLDFVRRIGSCSPSLGWDVALAKKFQRQGWSHTNLIRNFWGSPTISPEAMVYLQNEGAALLHGIKDESALNWARAALVV